MEILFETQMIKYLAEKRYDDLHQEQTGEINIPETLPELGRVVDCFGTVLVRDRTVENGSVSVAGGIQAGVLYVPAGEEGLEKLELWLPFTVTKKVPAQENAILHYWGWLRSIDARFVNPRKLLVRADLCSELTLLTPTELQLEQITDCPRGLICKTETFPMRLPQCAAEKEVRIADEVLMPEDGKGMDRMLKAQCSVELNERRVMGEKAIFQGELRLRVLGLTEEGEAFTWSGAVPFSQYLELDRSMEEEASLSIQPILNHMEIDTDGQADSRRLLVNLSFTAQAVVWDAIPVKLTLDAYYLNGEFAPEWQYPELMPCLDTLKTILSQSLAIPGDAGKLLDWTVLPDRISTGADCAKGNISVNLLYFDGENRLKNKLLRQELRIERQAEASADWSCALRMEADPAQQGRELVLPLTVFQRYCQSTGLRNLCGGTLTPKPPKEGPSIIIRSVSGDLWEIARDNGSTVRAIQAANELEDACISQERLLLIPTGRGANAMEEDAE